MRMQLPNILTLIRIVLSFLLLLVLTYDGPLLEGVHRDWVGFFGALVFVLASITDLYDGLIARRYGYVSKFGAVFDPLADKLLMLAAFLGLIYMGNASIWAIYLILAREFFITGLRVMAAGEGRDVSASGLGKLKTGLQVTAVIFLLLDLPLGNALLWVATFVTLYSGYEYAKSYYQKG